MALINFAVVHLFLMVSIAGGQLVTLTSPLGPNENFYCDQERVSCVGNRTTLLWTAPPSILDNAPQGFESTDTQQQPLSFGDVNITLTNVVLGSPTMLTSELTLSNIPEVNVTCQTDVPGSFQMLSLIRSTIPSIVGDHQLIYMGDSSFRSNWTTPAGTFDITNYLVQVRVDGSVLPRLTTTDTFVDIDELSLSGGEVIRVFVQAMSRCGEVGTQSSTVIVYVREINIVLGAVIALAVISALLLVFAAAGWLCACYCQTYERKSKCRKSTLPSPSESELKPV